MKTFLAMLSILMATVVWSGCGSSSSSSESDGDVTPTVTVTGDSQYNL